MSQRTDPNINYMRTFKYLEAFFIFSFHKLQFSVHYVSNQFHPSCPLVALHLLYVLFATCYFYVHVKKCTVGEYVKFIIYCWGWNGWSQYSVMSYFLCCIPQFRSNVHTHKKWHSQIKDNETSFICVSSSSSSWLSPSCESHSCLILPFFLCWQQTSDFACPSNIFFFFSVKSVFFLSIFLLWSVVTDLFIHFYLLL